MICVISPILFLIPSILQMVLGLGRSWTGMEKWLITSGEMKFSVVPLSIRALRLEVRVLDWIVTGV